MTLLRMIGFLWDIFKLVIQDFIFWCTVAGPEDVVRYYQDRDQAIPALRVKWGLEKHRQPPKED